MAILFVFPCSSSWCTLFFLSMHFSWRKLRNKIAFFRLFFKKKSKQVILFRDFLHEKCINRKNKVHHDDEHGKMKKMAVSDFLFSKLCHRNFCKTFSEISNFLKNKKNTNSVLLTQISSNHFSKEYICTRHMHTARTPGPPPPYLVLSPKKTIFLLGPSLKLKTKFFNSEK